MPLNLVTLSEIYLETIWMHGVATIHHSSNFNDGKMAGFALGANSFGGGS